MSLSHGKVKKKRKKRLLNDILIYQNSISQHALFTWMWLPGLLFMVLVLQSISKTKCGSKPFCQQQGEKIEERKMETRQLRQKWPRRMTRHLFSQWVVAFFFFTAASQVTSQLHANTEQEAKLRSNDAHNVKQQSLPPCIKLPFRSTSTLRWEHV